MVETGVGRCGGIVLCGGASRRMGRLKEFLPLGGETMLARVARIVGEVVQPVVAVAAPGRRLPGLPDAVVVVRDSLPGGGPLAGLADGLRALAGRCDRAFVCGCDAGLIRAAFVERVVTELGDHQAAVPFAEQFDQPLAGVYRLDVLPVVQALVDEADPRRRSPTSLLRLLDVRRLPPEFFTDVDPDLESLRRINTPEEYEAATARLGSAV